MRQRAINACIITSGVLGVTSLALGMTAYYREAWKKRFHHLNF